MGTVIDNSTFSPDAAKLLAAARNVNSQAGEDGIIEAILALLRSRDQWCVEFGAWDGRYLSNTRRLIDEAGYSAVLIEADKNSYSKLKQEFKSSPQVHCVQAFVGYDEHDSLDAILNNTACPLNFDVLSIDIDGNDIHVWSAIERYRPKLVVIEFNPMIPSTVNFIQPRDPGTKWGSSLRAMFELGCRKQYRLVCANEFNAFFVAREFWGGDYCRLVDELPRFRQEEPNPVYVFSGFDGTIHLSAECNLVWHQTKIGQRDLQALPTYLRRYPLEYSWLQRQAFRMLKKYRARKVLMRSTDDSVEG